MSISPDLEIYNPDFERLPQYETTLSELETKKKRGIITDSAYQKKIDSLEAIKPQRGL
ncbi:MAG: hypothetical protein J6Y55_05695 [Bacteroidales bacterium]|nr:hypothetical protein [Bacteroidales bacterium]